MVFASSYYDHLNPKQRHFDYCDGKSNRVSEKIVDEHDTVENVRLSVKSEKLQNINNFDPLKPGIYSCQLNTSSSNSRGFSYSATKWKVFYQNYLGRIFNFARFTDPQEISVKDDNSWTYFDSRNIPAGVDPATISQVNMAKLAIVPEIPKSNILSKLCKVNGEMYCVNNCLPCNGILKSAKDKVCLKSQKMLNKKNTSEGQKMVHAKFSIL